jgi:hypothetical protein
MACPERLFAPNNLLQQVSQDLPSTASSLNEIKNVSNQAFLTPGELRVVSDADVTTMYFFDPSWLEYQRELHGEGSCDRLSTSSDSQSECDTEGSSSHSHSPEP